MVLLFAQSRNYASGQLGINIQTEARSGMMTTSPPTPCTRMEHLSTEALAQVAAYFQTLSEPARLRLLNLLRNQKRSVGELAEATGYSAANVSRHLAMMAQHGLLARETQGTSVYYSIADPAIYELCNLVCDNLARRFERTAPQRSAFAPSRKTRTAPRTR
jgi:DNA-binding transcriptional ArsR family regulator